MVVCLSVLGLRQAGDLSRVYSASCPMRPGIGSSPPAVHMRSMLICKSLKLKMSALAFQHDCKHKTLHYHSHSFLTDIFALLSNLLLTAKPIKSHHTGTVANKFDLFGYTYTSIQAVSSENVQFCGYFKNAYCQGPWCN